MNVQFFTVFDIASALFVLLLIVVHSSWKRFRHGDEPHYSYFLPGIYFKLFIALSFSLFYIFYYNGGGDTVAYWDGAVKLNNLFWQSPIDYIAELFNSGDYAGINSHFDRSTGFPPSWIYGERESWLVSKIVSLLIIIGFKGYLAVTLLVAYFSSLATWRFFELVRSYRLHTDGWLAVAVFFIPSVAFWCSGISKDTLLYIALLLFICSLFQLFGPEKTGKERLLLLLLVSAYFLYGLRSVMFVAAMAPLLLAIGVRLRRRYAHSPPATFFIRIATIGFTAFVSFLILTNGSIVQSVALQDMLSEAQLIQQDFMHNQNYGGNRYDLGITDYSILGMVSAMPASIIAGLYRPFLNEALIPSLFLNGVESVFLLFFTVRFFLKRQLWQRIQMIRRQELLVYLFLLMLFIAFFSGFTSVLFGVLVRIRAFALPFLLIVLFAAPQEEPEVSA